MRVSDYNLTHDEVGTNAWMSSVFGLLFFPLIFLFLFCLIHSLLFSCYLEIGSILSIRGRMLFSIVFLHMLGQYILSLVHTSALVVYFVVNKTWLCNTL